MRASSQPQETPRRGPQDPSAARVTPARCPDCSKIVLQKDMDSHRRHLCSLRELRCGACGRSCQGTAALESHASRCKTARRSGSGRTGAKARVFSPVSSAHDFMFLFPTRSGSPSSYADSGSHCYPSHHAVSPSTSSGTAHTASATDADLYLPPPPLPLPGTGRGAAAAADSISLGDVVSVTCSMLCEYCRLSLRFPQEAVRHARVCGAAPVRCPLLCGAAMARREVPRHIRESARQHRALCLPSESDYGADHPRVVIAVLMEVLLQQQQQSETAGPDCASSDASEEMETSVPTRRRSSPQRDLGGTSPAATLPAPALLFHVSTVDGGSPTASPARSTSVRRSNAFWQPPRSHSKPLRDASATRAE